MSPTFREYRRTAPVEALQVTEDNAPALRQTIEAVNLFETSEGPQIVVQTREGRIHAPVADHPYLCRGPDGDYWLHEAEKFEERYEPASSTS